MYISEILTLEEMAKWENGNKILIDAQTGLGKSYWMQHELANFAKDKKILVLSNRTLLKRQNEKLSIKNVTCLNYQYVEQMKDKIESFLSGFDIINFDECHYFFRDVEFNKHADKVLKYAMSTQPKQIHIFASATPEPMLYSELKFDYTYRLERDYNYIQKVIFYDKIEDILPIILASRYKSMCFFSDAAQGCKFALSHPRQASFICSPSNELAKLIDKDALNMIVNQEKFPKKILATTTVLDNGVNVIDPQVKNIVVDLYSPLDIIQCIGRKRVPNRANSVTVYIKKPVVRMFKLKTAKLKPYYTYINDYGKQIQKVGFIKVWAKKLGLPASKLIIWTDYETLRKKLEEKLEQPLDRKEIAKLFEDFIPNVNRAKLVTFNALLKEHSIPYKIVSKPVYDCVTRKMVRKTLICRFDWLRTSQPETIEPQGIRESLSV